MKNKKLALERIDAWPVEKRVRGTLLDDYGNCCIFGAMGRAVRRSRFEYDRICAEFGLSKIERNDIYKLNDEQGWDAARAYIAALPDDDAGVTE